MPNPFDTAEQIRKVASDGASKYQLGFARERLEILRHKVKTNANPDLESLRDWIADIEFALGHISAVERRL